MPPCPISDEALAGSPQQAPACCEHAAGHAAVQWQDHKARRLRGAAAAGRAPHTRPHTLPRSASHAELAERKRGRKERDALCGSKSRHDHGKAH